MRARTSRSRSTPCVGPARSSLIELIDSIGFTHEREEDLANIGKWNGTGELMIELDEGYGVTAAGVEVAESYEPPNDDGE